MSPVHKYCQDWVTVRCSMSPVPKYCQGTSEFCNNCVTWVEGGVPSCLRDSWMRTNIAKTGSQFVAQCLLCTNIAQTEQHGTNEQHSTNWATRHKLSNTGAIEQRTRGAENARFSELWRLHSSGLVTHSVSLYVQCYSEPCRASCIFLKTTQISN